MSFVAEPYAEVVDNLLTALTGGIVYEDYIFKPGVSTYSFAHPPASEETIKVSGSVNLEYYVFVPDKDYQSGTGEILWLQDEAQLPDEGTRFYINYQPAAGHVNPLLTDRNVGSVTRLLAESFGREFTLLSKRLQYVYRSGFVDTAEGRSLEQVVAILGIQRKPAQYAVGNVVFLRDTESPADIFIPRGFQVSTEVPPEGEELSVTFETTAERVLRKGQFSVTVPARASVKGEPGLVSGKAITLMNRPLLGIHEITNHDATTFGTEPETDVQLRGRAKSQLERVGKTTVKALKYALLGIRAQNSGKISQLRENDIKIEEDFSQGPGLVRILLDAGGNDRELVPEVNRAIFETRAAGIAVVHNLKQPSAGEGPGPAGAGTPGASDEAEEAALAVRAALEALTATGEAEAASPAANEDDMEKPIVDLKKIEVTLSMTIALIDMELKEEEKETIASVVREAVAAYFDALAIGGKVIINQVINAVMNVDGVADIVRLLWISTLPNGQTNDGTRFDIQVPTDQKIVLTNSADSVDVNIAGSPVRCDCTIAATIDGNSERTQEEVENEIELKLAAFFDTVNGNLDLPKLQRALAGNQYTLSSMAVNVEYAETGLIIRNAQDHQDVIDIEENEIAVVGLVNIAVAGGVEGA
ncbi:MAG: hypothetical protein GY765_21575 [bacterium]|nr:hypothetical protein [bacterium]